MSNFANVFLGAAPNDGTGTDLRRSFQIVNQNFANIANGTADIVVVTPVNSVASRQGNVLLTVNDVYGAASTGSVANLSVTVNTHTTEIADLQAEVDAINANLSQVDFANVSAVGNSIVILQNNVVSINSNLGTMAANVASALSIANNVSGAVANITTLFANAATQANQISAANASIAAANTAITTANTAMKGYVDDKSASLTSSINSVLNQVNIVNAAWQANTGPLVHDIATLTATDTSLSNRINAANAAIVTANSGVISYVQSMVNPIAANTANILTNYTNLNGALVNINTLFSNAALQQTQINSVTANVTAANGAIVSANVGMKSYVDAVVSSLGVGGLQTQVSLINANLTAANAAIVTANIGLKSYVDYQISHLNQANVQTQIDSVVANVTAANGAIVSANVGMKSYVDYQISHLNQANVQTQIDSVVANVTAANAAIVTANTSMKSYVDAADALVVSNLTSNAAAQQDQINTIGANLSAFKTYANLTFGTSSYGNVDVAAYLPTSPIITGLTANVTAANAAIVTANTLMKSYVDAATTSTLANAATQQTQIDLLNANVTAANGAIVSANVGMKSYVDAVTTLWVANAATQQTQIDLLNANVTAANTTITQVNSNWQTAWDTANVAVMQLNANMIAANSAISSISANLVTTNATVQEAWNRANVTYVESTAALASANANVTAANLAISAISANIGAFETYANVTFDTTTSVVTKNVFLDVYDPISGFGGDYTLQITAQNITSSFASGKVNEYIKIGGTGYSGLDSKNIVIAPDAANGWDLSLGGITDSWSGFIPPAPTYIKTSYITDMYSTNVRVTSYANVATLNVSSAAAINGTITAEDYRWANGAPLVSDTYGNANVSAYLPTDSTITALDANVGTIVTSIASIDANIGAFQTYANVTFGTSSYGNVDVAAYLTSNVTVGSLTISNGATEQFDTVTTPSSTQDYDCLASHIFYNTSASANWTANFANLVLASGETTNISLVVAQGATPYYPSAVEISGVSQTIKWLGNATPVPAANAVEIATFTILNVSGTYTVLGAYSTYGG